MRTHRTCSGLRSARRRRPSIASAVAACRASARHGRLCRRRTPAPAHIRSWWRRRRRMKPPVRRGSPYCSGLRDRCLAERKRLWAQMLPHTRSPVPRRSTRLLRTRRVLIQARPESSTRRRTPPPVESRPRRIGPARPSRPRAQKPERSDGDRCLSAGCRLMRVQSIPPNSVELVCSKRLQRVNRHAVEGLKRGGCAREVASRRLNAMGRKGWPSRACGYATPLCPDAFAHRAEVPSAK